MGMEFFILLVIWFLFFQQDCYWLLAISFWHFKRLKFGGINGFLIVFGG